MTKRTKPRAKRKDDRCPHPAKARVHGGSVCGDCFEAIKPKPRARTPNAGAAAVRSEVLKHIEAKLAPRADLTEYGEGWNDALGDVAAFVRSEMIAKLEGMFIACPKRREHLGWNDAVEYMETFVHSMAIRASAKRGGLGRKAKR